MLAKFWYRARIACQVMVGNLPVAIKMSRSILQKNQICTEVLFTIYCTKPESILPLFEDPSKRQEIEEMAEKGYQQVIVAQAIINNTMNVQILGFYTTYQRAIHWLPATVKRFIDHSRNVGIDSA